MIDIPWKNIDTDSAPKVEETENYALVARYISADNRGTPQFVEIIADVSEPGAVRLWERVVRGIFTEWRTAEL